jgi:hypothetical protein
MLVSRTALLGVIFFGSALVAACGGSASNNASGTTGGAGGAATGTTGTTGTTSTSSTGAGASDSLLADDPPLVVDNGGAVLTHPKIQLIVYEEDPDATDAFKFLQELAATETWADQTAEYGVGPLTVLPVISIPGTPPATLDDNSGSVTPFQQTLANNISGANPVWGAADPSTIYMFQLPKGTDINSGGDCCSDFLGYHSEAPVGSGNVSYGISCNCGVVPMVSLTALQWVTTTLSHEAVEAATDPFPFSSTAWSGNDNDHWAWSAATGGEVADMCEFEQDSNYIPPGATYMVQRSWSNKASKAGANPCVPVPPTGPYFQAVPTLTDTVTLNPFGSNVQTKGVIIPVGQSKTIDVTLEAEAPTNGPWTVTAYDFSSAFNGGATDLKLSLDKSSGSNGDTLHLTITSLKADDQDVSALFVLVSDIGSGADLQENMFFGAVGQ